MLSQSINEITWHFLGYLKLREDLATTSIRYDHAISGFEDVLVEQMVDVKPWRTEEPEELPSTNASPVGADPLGVPIAVPDLSLDFIPALNGIVLGPEGQSPVDAPAQAVPSRPVDGPAPVTDWELDVELNYDFFSAPGTYVGIEQENALQDDDVLVQDHVVWAPASELPSAEAVLQSAVEASEAAVVPGLLAELAQPEPELAKEAAQGQVTRAENGFKDVTVKIGENTGTYDPTEFEAQKDGEAETAPVSQKEPEAPEHSVALGDNEATNVAVIADLIEAKTSVVVMGDYYATNAIVQSNVYVGAGQTTQQAASTGEPTLFNASEISSSGETLISSYVSGASALYSFDVDVAVGNLYNVSVVQQYNFLSDNDHIQYELNSGGSYVSLGDNTQVNAAQVIKDVSAYDMIITAGDYFDLNYISQRNVLLDADRVSWEASGLTDAGQGNRLINDAKIKTIGGGSLFKPMDSEASAFFSGIAQHESSLTYKPAGFEFGFPQIGSTDFKVLFVTGNSYHLNVIEQVNVLSDMDTGRIIGEGAATGEFDTPNYGSGSANLARNKAEIIDYDSQSGFQYLGGAYSEEDLLIQVNISVEDSASAPSQLKSAGDLVNEVIAFTGGENSGPTDEGGYAFASLNAGDLFSDLLT
ncbi:hypothetical protein [Pseudovibrio sp. SPO723]|uniref:hypothetical protein n=1 Tax=Nesiotobacter zosterae TaxID=392721 RepID=UPI0029C54BE0|nr:hypothetical protein [Pseudovibrio sp. SPO723]MDX5593420.1 hypothetical protein [Pseudovibrio sp. SPO723]